MRKILSYALCIAFLTTTAGLMPLISAQDGQIDPNAILENPTIERFLRNNAQISAPITTSTSAVAAATRTPIWSKTVRFVGSASAEGTATFPYSLDYTLYSKSESRSVMGPDGIGDSEDVFVYTIDAGIYTTSANAENKLLAMDQAHSTAVSPYPAQTWPGEESDLVDQIVVAIKSMMRVNADEGIVKALYTSNDGGETWDELITLQLPISGTE